MERTDTTQVLIPITDLEVVLGTPFGPSTEPFITPYGFSGNNSGMVFASINNYGVLLKCWVFRAGVTAGLRPCVKIKSGIHFDSDSLTLK